MRIFSGTYNSKIDKGRCFLPAQFRKELPETGVAHLKINVTENEQKYLEIYEDSDWIERIDDLKNLIKYEPFDYDKEEIMQSYVANFVDVEMDITSSKNAGRMLIPKKMLEAAGIKNEVVFVGTYGMVLMWDKEKYENRPTKNLKSRITEIAHATRTFPSSNG